MKKQTQQLNLNLRKIEYEKYKLAETVRGARRYKHFSIQQLANKSAVNYKTVWKIENTKSVSYESIIKVLLALEIELSFSYL